MPNRSPSLLGAFDFKRIILSLPQDKWDSLKEHLSLIDVRRADVIISDDRLAIRPKSAVFLNVFYGYRIVASREGANVVVAETLAGGLFSNVAKAVGVAALCMLPFIIYGAIRRGDGWLTALAAVGFVAFGLITIDAMARIGHWQSRVLFGRFTADLIAKFGKQIQ